MGSIWDKVNSRKPEKNSEPQKELTDEIRNFRAKQKEFEATNDHQTYVLVVFSTKEDKNEFLKSCGMRNDDTMIDGYAFAKKIGKTPIKPKFRLKDPF